MARPFTDEIVFRDLDIQFTPHPVTKNIPQLTNDKAIARAVRNAVLTNKYERPYQPDLYTNVLYSLFEHFDTITANILKERIISTLKNFEGGRVQVIDVRVDPTAEQNTVRCYHQVPSNK